MLLTSSEAPELERWQITKTQRTEKAIQNSFSKLIKLYVVNLYNVYTSKYKFQAKLPMPKLDEFTFHLF